MIVGALVGVSCFGFLLMGRMKRAYGPRDNLGIENGWCLWQSRTIDVVDLLASKADGC